MCPTEDPYWTVIVWWPLDGETSPVTENEFFPAEACSTKWTDPACFAASIAAFTRSLADDTGFCAGAVPRAVVGVTAEAGSSSATAKLHAKVNAADASRNGAMGTERT